MQCTRAFVRLPLIYGHLAWHTFNRAYMRSMQCQITRVLLLCAIRMRYTEYYDNVHSQLQAWRASPSCFFSLFFVLFFFYGYFYPVYCIWICCIEFEYIRFDGFKAFQAAECEWAREMRCARGQSPIDHRWSNDRSHRKLFFVFVFLRIFKCSLEISPAKVMQR